MPGYLQFADDLLDWYDKILLYTKHKIPHTNLKIEVDPTPEKNDIHNSAYSHDTIIIQNAADEQVALFRSMRERDRDASFYFNEWTEFIQWERDEVFKFKPVVKKRKEFIASTSVKTQKFYSGINKDQISHLTQYDPWASIQTTPDTL